MKNAIILAAGMDYPRHPPEVRRLPVRERGKGRHDRRDLLPEHDA